VIYEKNSYLSRLPIKIDAEVEKNFKVNADNLNFKQIFIKFEGIFERNARS
jgi:hypothetical protein